MVRGPVQRTAVTLGVLAGLLAACVAPLDRRVPWRAFRASRESLLAAARHIDRGQVEVGWAKAPIIAPEGAPLGGYAERSGDPHQEVRDPGFARALVIRVGGGQPLIFLAFDLLLLDPDTSAELSRTLSGLCPRERLYLTATHTHSGMGGFAPGLAFQLALGRFSEAAQRAVVVAGTQAARAAVLDLEPGRFALSEVLVEGLVTNRIRAAGTPVDPGSTLLLLAKDEDGSRAVLVTYAAHATTGKIEDRALSADYPGVVVRILEQEGFALAAFAAGTPGSMAPKVGPVGVAGAESTGSRLAYAVKKAVPRAARRLRKDAALATLRTKVTLPRYEWRALGADWAVHGPLVGLALPSSVFIQAASFGSQTWVTVPVELSGELGVRLRARAQARGRVLGITAFNGEYAGYVVPRSAYDLEQADKGALADYEAQVMSFYGPWMGELFSAAIWRAALAAEEAAGGQAHR